MDNMQRRDTEQHLKAILGDTLAQRMPVLAETEAFKMGIKVKPEYFQLYESQSGAWCLYPDIPHCSSTLHMTSPTGAGRVETSKEVAALAISINTMRAAIDMLQACRLTPKHPVFEKLRKNIDALREQGFSATASKENAEALYLLLN